VLGDIEFGILNLGFLIIEFRFARRAAILSAIAVLLTDRATLRLAAVGTICLLTK